MKKVWIVLMVVAALIVAAGCANKYTTSGKIAMKSKNYEKAIHDFNLALEADSTNPEVHFLLGEAYRHQGDHMAMNKHYADAMRLSPKYDAQIQGVRDSVWADFFKRGIEKAKEKKFQDALGDFQMAINIQPNRYEAFTNAGYVFQNMTESNPTYIDSAYTYYQRALDLDKSNVNVLINFGNLAYGMQKFGEADTMFAVVLEKDPNNIDALIRRGEIADQQNRYEDAVGYYNRALQIDPTDSSMCNVWFNLGVVYFQQMKKMDDAEQAFSRAVDLCPNDANAQVNLNVVLITNNKLDDAISRLTQFTNQNPNECVGWDLLSQALLRKGKKEEAYAANKKFEECRQAH